VCKYVLTSLRSAADVEYDYIVIGSGAGGGVVASRLALKKHRVLLVEAGEDRGNDPIIDVPGFHGHSSEHPPMSWDFFVQHYSNTTQAARDKKFAWEKSPGEYHVGPNPPQSAKPKGLFYPRATTLGGCTAHNAMVHVYPAARDWDYIASITGDESWKAPNMRQYLKKLEKVEYPFHDAKGKEGHGFDGWLGVDKANSELSKNDTKVLRMGNEAGIAMKKLPKANLIQNANAMEHLLGEGDLNSADPERDFKEGLFTIPLDMYKGKRTGSRNFIRSVMATESSKKPEDQYLHLQTNTLVTKILFETSGGKPKAVGVEALVGPHLYKASPLYKSGNSKTKITLRAKKEVILAAGAFNSPQLLKLSGIGPKAELEQHKIPVIADLPGVGTNLQDHFEIGVTHEASDPFPLVTGCKFGKPADPEDNCYKLWQQGKGPYFSSNGFPFALLKRSSVATTKEPDLFVFGGISNFTGYFPGYSKQVYSKKAWTWVILLAFSQNTAGTVKLTSADPQDPPLIESHYFDDLEKFKSIGHNDLQAMSEGIQLARSVSDAVSPLSPLEKAPPVLCQSARTVTLWRFSTPNSRSVE
jgi:choline dehydrogenase